MVQELSNQNQEKEVDIGKKIRSGMKKKKKNGGARGVIVIVVGNEHGDSSSNPGLGWLHFT